MRRRLKFRPISAEKRANRPVVVAALSKYLRLPRRRGAFALSLCCLVLAAPGFAAAATTSPVDTVNDTVESVLDPVKDAAEPITDAVEDATQPVTDTVDETTKPVRDTVDGATQQVTDTINDPTSDSGTDTDTGAGGTGRSTDGDRSTGEESAKGPSRDAGRWEPAAAATRRAVRQRVPEARADMTRREAAARHATPALAATPRDSTSGGIARAVVDASRAFRFPLLLAAAVLLFLGVQGRVDRRDPKLAHAADDEELMFA